MMMNLEFVALGELTLTAGKSVLGAPTTKETKADLISLDFFNFG